MPRTIHAPNSQRGGSLPTGSRPSTRSTRDQRRGLVLTQANTSGTSPQRIDSAIRSASSLEI
jgi:hypothetical protein